MKIISSRNSEQFSKSIAAYLGVDLVRREIYKFASGEFCVDIQESIKGEYVFLIANTFPDIHESLMEIFLLIDGIKKSGASKITLALPYFAYARQDQSDGAFSGFCTISNIFKSIGINKIITFDIHSPSAKEIYGQKLENITSAKLLKEFIRRNRHIDVLASPDLGKSELILHLSKEMNLPYVLLSKKRLNDSICSTEILEGEAINKSILLIDDIVDTGNTLVSAAETLKKAGALSIDAFATHGLFAKKSIDMIKKSSISSLTITDSINNMSLELQGVSVVSIVNDIAESILRSIKQELVILL